MQSSELYFGATNSSIHYETIGTGAPLLLLAGGPGLDAGYMSGMLKPLSEKYKVILLHQRGTGKSIGSADSKKVITLAQYLEDIEEVRKELRISKWSVLGHSWGGMLAAAYTAKHSNCVDDLILVNTAGLTLDIFSYLTDNVLQRLSGDVYNNAIGLLTAFQETNDPALLGQFFITTQSAYFSNKTLVEGFVNKMEPSSLSVTTYGALMQDLAAQQFTLKGKFTDFAGQAIFITSRQDIIGAQPLLDCQESFKNLKVHTIEKAGHYPWEEQPEQFYSLLL